jgi:signal transduction histidine kinase
MKRLKVIFAFDKIKVFIFGIVFLFLFFCYYNLLIFQRAIKEKEKMAAEYSLARLAYFLENKKDNLLNQVLELGVWSELFEQVKKEKKDEEWFRDNIDNWLPVVKLDFAYIFDKNGQLYHQTAPLVFDFQPLFNKLKKKKNLCFFLKRNGKIFNIAGSLINRSEDFRQEGEYAGFIVVGKILKEDLIKKETKTDFVLREKLPKENFLPLKDYEDKPIFYLALKKEKDIPIHRYLKPVWFLLIFINLLLIFLAIKEVKKKIKEEKERQFLFFGKLMGFIIHELKNPLATISNCLYLLKEIKEGEKRKVYLEIMGKAIENMKATIDTFLKISKGEKGEKEVVFLKDLLEEIKREVVVNNNIKFDNLLEEPIKVYGDRRQLKHALKNIIKNSVESIKEKGEIKIDYEVNNGRLKLVIADNGSGIDKKHLKKVFEPFYTTKEKGMGLGLFLARYLLELNNGKIELFSEEGKGTKVVITFENYE